MHTDKDDSLRQALEDLAPPVEEGGVWGYLQTKIAARRVRRRRRLVAAGVGVAVFACLAFAVFAAIHWWPRQSQVLVVGDGPMAINTGSVAQMQTDSDGT